jgi:hypothetical protein
VQRHELAERPLPNRTSTRQIGASGSRQYDATEIERSVVAPIASVRSHGSELRMLSAGSHDVLHVED